MIATITIRAPDANMSRWYLITSTQGECVRNFPSGLGSKEIILYG